MHPDVHLLLHHARAAELRRATPLPTSHRRLRSQLGWTMVELGLRMVNSSELSRPAPGNAARRPCPSVS